MAKLTDYTPPPPELGQLLDLTTAIVDRPAPAKTIAKVKPKAKRKKHKRRFPKLYADLEHACAELAARLNMPPAQPGTDDFIAAQVAALKRGFFDPLYWTPCEKLWTEYLSCEPHNALDPAPPPYAYRDPDNAPSKVTYPDGQTGYPPPRFDGATVFHAWHDLGWTWSKTLWRLAAKIDNLHYQPTLLSIAGNIVVDADRRGSRPMFTVVCAAFIGDENNPDISTLRPPLAKTISFHWRYHVPPTMPPFYHPHIERQMLASLLGRAKFQPSHENTHACVTIAPAPMKGKRFNNNTHISTALYTEAQIYQLRPPPVALATPYSYEYGDVIWTFDRDTLTWESHNAPELSLWITPRENRTLYYSILYGFWLQNDTFDYIADWPDPSESGWYVATVYANPSGFVIVTADGAAPLHYKTYAYDPQGALLAATYRGNPPLYSNGDLYASGYNPYGGIYGLISPGTYFTVIWSLEDGTYCGETGQARSPIYRVLRSRTGLWLFLADGAIYFTAWPQDLEPRTPVFPLSEAEDSGSSVLPGRIYCPVEDGLFAYDAAGNSFVILDTFEVLPQAGMPEWKFSPGDSLNLNIIPA